MDTSHIHTKTHTHTYTYTYTYVHTNMHRRMTNSRDLLAQAFVERIYAFTNNIYTPIYTYIHTYMRAYIRMTNLVREKKGRVRAGMRKVYIRIQAQT